MALDARRVALRWIAPRGVVSFPVVPEQGRITATVEMVTTDAGTKLRAVVWSGPDFRTPTIEQGAIFEDADEAAEVAEKVRDAFRVVGIPIEGDVSAGDHAQRLLPEKRPESEYDRR